MTRIMLLGITFAFIRLTFAVLKCVLSISLMLGVLLQSFSKGIIEIQFHVQQDYIERYLCENRSQPEKKCHGHCHLKKSLEKEHQKDKSQHQNSREVLLFFQSPDDLIPQSEKCESIRHSPTYKNFIIQFIAADNFHPPESWQASLGFVTFFEQESL